jgi:hypothetical protein
MELLEKKIATTHRVQEHDLLKRLEHFCKRAGLEFPTDASPKDDRKAYFIFGLCATEDMKDLGFRERLARLDDWARQHDLLKPNETLFATRR